MAVTVGRVVAAWAATIILESDPLRPKIARVVSLGQSKAPAAIDATGAGESHDASISTA
ncbi:MAG: hypothetical protein ACE5F6_17905 [Anaerolineae bacterium]